MGCPEAVIAALYAWLLAFQNRDKKWLERPNGLALVEFGEFFPVKAPVMLSLEEERNPFFFSVCRLDADFDVGYFPGMARAVAL